MKFVSSVLILVISLGAMACGPRKPAYSDINPDQSARNENQNSSGQPTAPTEAGGQQPGSPAQPAAPETKPFKVPDFLDQATGQIKDLPSYPQAIRQNIQYGPVDDQGVMKDTMSLLLVTGDAMDKIADFYDKSIKSHGWTVTDKLRDRELSQWTLKKGNTDEAKVEVKKDAKSLAMYIALARTQVQPKPKQ
ncbi:MAG TPA: hypothetical protein VJZ26_05495 [Blastocatellia bacterium]|nr:hypothetical protein [Blastocatellia bacterium]